MVAGDPFTCTWLFTDFPRTDRVVLEANTDHWNKERGPRLEKVVYVNDIDPAEALEKVCETEGEIDIVSEVSPEDARKVTGSEHANLVTVDALRVVSGLINRNAQFMNDGRVRKALNLAVDRDRLIDEVFQGYAHRVAALAPPYSGGAPEGLEPYACDPEEAKRLLSEAGWPEGRALRIAATSDVVAVAERLSGDFRDSLGVEVETIIIPDEDLIPSPENARGEEPAAPLRRACSRLVRPRSRLPASGHPPRILSFPGSLPSRASPARVRGADGPLRRRDRRR